MRILLIDNHDSYTYNLFQLLAVIGAEPAVVANDDPVLATAEPSSFDALVLSPGPGRPEVAADVGAALDVVTRWGLPTLGVCLGHQGLAWLAGATIVPAPTARHGGRDRIHHVSAGLFNDIPQGFPAVRYHSLCVRTPAPDALLPLAWSDDGVLMAFAHASRPWWGVQFHPESIATEHGQALLGSFLRLAADAPAPRSGGRLRPRPEHTARPVTEPAPAPAPRRSPGTGHLQSPTRAADQSQVFQVAVSFIGTALDGEHVWTRAFASADAGFWLDSSDRSQRRARFSFLGDAGGPHGEVLRYDVSTRSVEVTSAAGRTNVAGSILDVLDARLRARSVAAAADLPFDLVGGYVGYLGYEVKADCGAAAAHRSPTPDALWMAATRVVAIDHDDNCSYVMAVHDGRPANRRAAERWVAATTTILRASAAADPTSALDAVTPDGARAPGPTPPAGAVAAALGRGRAQYLADVARCKALLLDGQSYEICLTDRVRVPLAEPAERVYRRLRSCNPAPYAAFLRAGDLAVLCSSPERFLRVSADGLAESRPIKGTAPRSPDARADAEARRGLALDEKSRAENLMIVDLVRNDLGRVCRVGSVEVSGFMAVESYATVHQLVSTVQGRLRPDVTAVGATRACFPPGSMTGAPKARTMAFIDELEGRARGVYSGVLGWFGTAGTCDLAVTIRTIVVEGDGMATVGAGGAVVLDSDPVAEYEEMVTKAMAPLRAVAWPAQPARS